MLCTCWVSTIVRMRAHAQKVLLEENVGGCWVSHMDIRIEQHKSVWLVLHGQHCFLVEYSEKFVLTVSRGTHIACWPARGRFEDANIADHFW